MASILCIESSTDVCSVALSADGKVASVMEDRSGKNHALLLTGFVDKILNAAGITYRNLDAIAISGGPGSYTGLRIGVSTAKGLCYGLGLPLIAVPTLYAMAHYMALNTTNHGIKEEEDLLYCPMLDARRMEVYAALYDRRLQCIRDIRADIIDHLSFSEFLGKNRIVFFGNGADKCRSTITHPNAIFPDPVKASASFLAGPAEEAFQAGNFVSVAYYEPFYLKDFVATVSKKNLLVNK